jgi:hypothetical protein
MSNPAPRFLTSELLFFTSSLAASLACYVFSRPSRKELAVVATAAVVLAAWLGLGDGLLYAQATLLAAYGGVAACILTFVLAFTAYSRKRVEVLEFAMAPPLITLGTAVAGALVSRLRPVTLDYYLYSFDGSLGFQPGFAAGELLYSTPWLRVLCEGLYMNLPLALCFVYLLERWRSPEAGTATLKLYVSMAAIGVVSYVVFPAVGSAVAFGANFPGNPPPLEAVPRSILGTVGEPRNCIPSLHTCWGMALWFCTLQQPRAIRVLIWTYIGPMLLCTLACGHYLVDMIVAPPVFVACALLTHHKTQESKRTSAILIGFFVLWLLALRWTPEFFYWHPALPWIVSMVAVVTPIIALRRHMPVRSPRQLEAAVAVETS